MASDSPKILVVDDEAAIVEGLCEALDLLGYQACAAFDGQQALDSIEEDRPDLVVMDVLMPRLDGIQALRMVRRNPATKDLPVIILTALGSDVSIVEGIKAGATMYLTKPVEVSKIAALISAILGPRRAPGGESAS